MELAPDRAGDLGHPALDRHVDVLVGGLELELAALELGGRRTQRRLELGPLGCGQHAGGLERRDVRERPAHVLRARVADRSRSRR